MVLKHSFLKCDEKMNLSEAFLLVRKMVIMAKGSEGRKIGLQFF